MKGITISCNICKEKHDTVAEAVECFKECQEQLETLMNEHQKDLTGLKAVLSPPPKTRLCHMIEWFAKNFHGIG